MISMKVIRVNNSLNRSASQPYRNPFCEQVPEIDWAVPGEDAGMEWLLKRFLGKGVARYDTDRNDPTIPTGVSGLSPYLHYGQVSAQVKSTQFVHRALQLPI
jgi:deoxyribodipyrimidine photolyase